MSETKQITQTIALNIGDALRETQKHADARLKELSLQKSTGHILALFCDPKDQYKHAHYVKQYGNDTGLMFAKVQGMITEIALDPKWEEHIRQSIERIYQEELDKAMRLAAEHQARKTVFGQKPKEETK